MMRALFNLKFGLVTAVAAASIACALALAGCASTPNVVVSEGDSTPGITVTASSEVKVVPDKASMGVSITGQAATAEAVQSDNAKKTNELLRALAGLGIDKKNVQTTGTYLSPRYDYPDDVNFDVNDSTNIVGYEMTTSFEISGIDIDKVGSVLQACVDAGANGANGIQYYSSTYDESYQKALTEAMDKARVKAETLAKAGGAGVGGILYVSEGYQDTGYRYESDEVAMAESANDASGSMKVMPGEIDINASVTVTYAIK